LISDTPTVIAFREKRRYMTDDDGTAAYSIK
jgi:hypothetical protein